MAYKSPAAAPAVIRSDSVIAAALRPPLAANSASSSPSYQQAALNKIKQEPGSPANQFSHHLTSRPPVKQEPGGASGHLTSYHHPQSPQTSGNSAAVVVAATPPPPQTSQPSSHLVHQLGSTGFLPARLERVSGGGGGVQTAPAIPAPPPTPRPGGMFSNYPSPRQAQPSTPMSPAGSIGASGSGGEPTKFRYHSGQQQQLGLVQNPSPQGEETSTCNSAMWSREGTPGPPPTPRHHQWTAGEQELWHLKELSHEIGSGHA